MKRLIGCCAFVASTLAVPAAGQTPDRTLVFAEAGVGGVPYPLGNSGCGDGSGAFTLSAGVGRGVGSRLELVGRGTVMPRFVLAHCAETLVPRPPGEYHDRIFDPTVADGVLPSVDTQLRLRSGARRGVEARAGAGLALSHTALPFVAAGIGARLGGRLGVTIGAEARAFRVPYDERHSVIREDPPSYEERTTGSGATWKTGWFLVLGIAPVAGEGP